MGARINVVRYSPAEVGLPGFADTSAVIYFCKDPTDFPDWVGGTNAVTFHSHYKERDAISAPRLADYRVLAQGSDVSLYGVNIPDGGLVKGPIHFSEQMAVMASAGCYLYVWTQPPSYTLSLVEAMMAGLPIIAPSAAFVSACEPSPMFGWQPSRYEVDALLGDGCGLVYDSIEEGRSQVRHLLANQAMAKTISERSRRRAVSLFGIDAIILQWNGLLSSLSGCERVA